MPHFFIKSGQVNNDKISISDKENYFHIARSLRARKGEKLSSTCRNSLESHGMNGTPIYHDGGNSISF